MDACAELATLAGHLAEESASPRDFLLRLGEQGAGIRRGPLWMIDAALAGRNALPGRGFTGSLDDGTTGQARHFAGTVAASTHMGASITRWLSVHLRRDPLDSADGRLSELAIRFTRLVRSGELPPAEAQEWIHANLCASA